MSLQGLWTASTAQTTGSIVTAMAVVSTSIMTGAMTMEVTSKTWEMQPVR